ncbi:MAG: LptA/OstA family protein [candidate division WOR-3 bacterium]
MSTFGAEIYARKMEIVRTPEGQATIFRDSVVITDSSTRLFSQSCRLLQSRSLAVMNDSVQIESPDARVWADSAVYRLNEKRAELFGRVRVLQDSLAISAPSLVYSTLERQVRADRGLTLENLGKTWRLTGQRGMFNLDSGVGVVDSMPVLSRLERETVEVTSRVMSWFEKETKAAAFGAIRMTSGASELCCDTAIFFAQSDSGVAWGNPQVRDSAGAASGDTMLFLVRNGALEQVAIRKNARGRYRTASHEEVLVQGETIRLALAHGNIDRIEVEKLTLGQLVRRPEESR